MLRAVVVVVAIGAHNHNKLNLSCLRFMIVQQFVLDEDLLLLYANLAKAEHVLAL